MSPTSPNSNLLHELSSLSLDSPDEAVIEKRIKEYRTSIEELDRAITELDHALTLKKAQRASQVKQLEALISTRRPINRLPDDALYSIFKAATPPNPDIVRTFGEGDSRQMGADHPLVMASQVCQRWRSVALSHSTLWSQVSFFIPDQTIEPGAANATRRLQEILEEWLRRSAQCPLDIMIGHFSQSDPPLTVDPGDMHSALQELLLPLCREARRWKSLLVAGRILHPSSAPVMHLLKIPRDDLPNLTSIQVICELSTTQFGVDQHQLLFDGPTFGAPNIRKVSMVPFIRLSVPPLRMPQYPHITSLVVGGEPVWPGGGLTTREALGVLRGCPNLVSCELNLKKTLHVDLNSVPAAPVLLSSLTSLAIQGLPPAPGTADLLILPSLRKLAFTEMAQRPVDPAGLSGIHRFITNLGDQLEEFECDPVVLKEGEDGTSLMMETCLEHLPNVKRIALLSPHFELDGDTTPSSIELEASLLFQELSKRASEGSAVVCPHLEVIECMSISDKATSLTEEALIQLLNARCTRPQPEGVVCFLKKVEIRFHGSKSVGELEAFEGKDWDVDVKLDYCKDPHTYIHIT